MKFIGCSIERKDQSVVAFDVLELIRQFVVAFPEVTFCWFDRARWSGKIAFIELSETVRETFQRRDWTHGPHFDYRMILANRPYLSGSVNRYRIDLHSQPGIDEIPEDILKRFKEFVQNLKFSLPMVKERTI